MSVPDWLLVCLGLVGLAATFALAANWLGVCLVVGLAAGFAVGLWA